MLGPRAGYGLPTNDLEPHSLVLTVMGASMLWVGWFGFNAGSAAGANASAGLAMMTTQIATAAAGMTWMLIEWKIKDGVRGKPGALGLVSGAVAGLVGITPAAGFVGPVGAMVIGVVTAAVCYWSTMHLKEKIGYDDSLDAFGIHGVGGMVGSILTGIFGTKALGGVGITQSNVVLQVLSQTATVVITIVWSGGVAFVLLTMLSKVMRIRVSEWEEDQGLDEAQHSEKGYSSHPNSPRASQTQSLIGNQNGSPVRNGNMTGVSINDGGEFELKGGGTSTRAARIATGAQAYKKHGYQAQQSA